MLVGLANHAGPDGSCAFPAVRTLIRYTGLPERTVGEVRLSGPSIMRGYWEDSERTRDAFAGPFLSVWCETSGLPGYP